MTIYGVQLRKPKLFTSLISFSVLSLLYAILFAIGLPLNVIKLLIFSTFLAAFLVEIGISMQAGRNGKILTMTILTVATSAFAYLT